MGLTPTGWTFLKERANLTLVRAQTSDEAQDMPAKGELDYDRALFGKLRDLRRRMAAERNVPPYVIFGDNTLQQMAHFVPQSLDSLSRISGVGTVKLDDMGEEFLSLITAHARMNDLQAASVNAYPIPAWHRRCTHSTATPTKTKRLTRTAASPNC